MTRKKRRSPRPKRWSLPPIEGVRDRLIGRLPDDKHCSTIVDAIIAMAKSLGLVIIAEGVENQVQFDFLKSRDCDIVQGYFTGRPHLAGEFSALLEKKSLQRSALDS